MGGKRDNVLLCFQREPQTKAEKIKLALEKLKEAKMRKVRSADFLLCVCVCAFNLELK